MELNLSQTMKQFISALLLIILPLIIIGLGAAFRVENAIFYLLSVIWFAMGVIFFGAIN